MIDEETSGAITVAWLEERRACKRQVRLFRKVFGESAGLTRENAVKAARGGLNTRWLAIKLLGLNEWYAYYRHETLAWNACLKADGTRARDAYREAQAAALCDVLGLP